MTGRDWRLCATWVFIVLGLPVAHLSAQGDSARAGHGDSISVHLVDTDLRAAVQSLARYLDRPVIFGAITGARVTVETPGPVPRAQVLQLLRGVLQSQNFELIADSGSYRVQPRAPAAALDAPRPGRPVGTVELFAIHLRHARAADVAATVNALYGHASALGEIGSMPQMLDQQLRQDRIPPGQITSPGQQAPVLARSAVFTGDVTIVPDPRSNSLLIRATPEDFELVQAAVKELDIRPLQVLIQVLIAEVRTNGSFFLGLDAQVGPLYYKNGAVATASTSANSSVTDFVMQVMHLGGANINATLTAAVEHGDVRILSRPVILAANNQQAQILVGSQRPFIQVSRSLPTDAATRDQVVQYKDVGTRLVVRPTISPDGYVVLEVTQEVNLATSEVQFNAPVISTRQVQTQLLIKDGQTVVIGGLSDEQRDATQGGVPVLSSIPLIGGLFGHVSRTSAQTELFLFLTPHVIRSDAEADSLSAPLLERAQEKKP